MDVQNTDSSVPLPSRPPGDSGTSEPGCGSPLSHASIKKKTRSSRRKRKNERSLDQDVDSYITDESMSKQELQELQQAEESLKRDCIYRLKKGRKPRRYPTAVYTCKLCDAFLESIASANKHIKERRHKKYVMEKEEEELLITLPPPTAPQTKVIDLAIDKIVQTFGLNNEDLEQRLEIKRLMEMQVHQILPGSSLRLYGSSSTRFGFKNSDINIDIQIPDSMAQPDVLLLVQESLKNSKCFIDVDTDFHARVPVVVCREKQSGLVCKVSAGNDSACLTSNHLAAIGRLEPKLIPLVIAFRYWGKLCHIDSPDEGGLPPFVFGLMAVFFLQQRKIPVLPVYLGSWRDCHVNSAMLCQSQLHSTRRTNSTCKKGATMTFLESIQSADTGFIEACHQFCYFLQQMTGWPEKRRCTPTPTVTMNESQSFLKVLKQEARAASAMLQKLRKRPNSIKAVLIEGFSLRKIANFNLVDVENDEVIWEYNPAAIDETHPREEDSSKMGKEWCSRAWFRAPKPLHLMYLELDSRRLGDDLIFDKRAPLMNDRVHPCSIPVGQLWVELLRFYTVEFKFEDLVISVRFKGPITRDMKDWPKKRIAVEDPFSVKWNATKCLNSQLVFEYILHCLRVTYKYFALPHIKPSSCVEGKPINTNLTSTQHQKTEMSTRKDMCDGHVENDIHAIDSRLKKVALEDPVSTIMSPRNQESNSHNVFDSCDSQTEENLADIENLDSDCVTEDVIQNNLGKYKSNYEDIESGNEEYDYREQTKAFVTIDQSLDDSENGEAVILHLDHDGEIDSSSDIESFPNPVLIESDEDGAEDVKVDLEEGSTEGTDELEGPVKHIALSRCEHISKQNNSEEEVDEEEVSVGTKQRDHFDSLNLDDEVGITYTASGDEEALSDEEEEELSDCITAKYQNPEEQIKPVNELIQVDSLSEEDFTLVSDTLSLEKDAKNVMSDTLSEEWDFTYKFSRRIFTKGKSPTVVCSLCKRDGHLNKDCPEDFKKIELDPLPKMTSKFQMILDQVCTQCFNDFSPDALEDQAREYIRQNLENFIKQEFQAGATLSLFGSSKNGFGFKQSDLDICMRLDGHETAEELDCVKIIEDLAKVLRKHSGLRNILPITTAKVPIVKFFHVRSGLEGDISLYNTLALHNTRLLAAYAAFDPRVKYLCYIMKVFTKMCDIGDASRGSLSSYAYTLMVLYFLQQRNPPVIPVLQEIYTGPRKPEMMVEGWNVYFFDKLDELSSCWPNYGKNKESVGELWLALLRFYTEEFDFKEHVICIRRKSLLTTFKKQWTSKYIVIEDPFDLNHNLGAGLSRKMAYFIMKAFMNGRRVFGTPLKSFPKEYPTKMEYFFDPEVLTEGELAPNDRCCRICGKIGHFLRECPMRRKHRRRWENEGNMNQRYPEKSVQRNDQEKDTPSKNSDKEISSRDGKIQPPCTPPKHRQGAWGGQEIGRDNSPRFTSERWRRQEDRDFKDKNCFVCGREGHIKKACPQYRPSGGSKSDSLCGSPSSPSSVRQASRLHQVMHPHDEKRKQQGKLSLCPQSGSLASKFMAQGKASQRKTPQEP